MKKTILIISTVLITSSLTALGYTWGATETGHEEVSSNETVSCKKEQPKKAKVKEEREFIYNVDHRFNTTITKEKLFTAKSVIDLVPKSATEGMSDFREVKIAVLAEGDDPFEMGKIGALNSAQLTLLKTTDYSTNFYIEAYCKNESPDAGKSDNYRFVYYLTIVPEKVAQLEGGQMALINYIKKKSKDEVAKVKMDVLKPGKAYFTISKNGKITDVKLDSESGYTSLDQKMVDLITAFPGTWTPATNSKGENIEQKLVFSYGYMGC